MTALLDQIRARGGEVIRAGWTISLRPGRLSTEAIEWLRERKDRLALEVWPEFDAFEERAAILQFDAGMSRDDAEVAAYAEVMNA